MNNPTEELSPEETIDDTTNEVIEMVDDEPEADSPAQLSKGEIVKSLNAAVEDGSIPQSMARRLRLELGVGQKEFTTKKFSSAKRKAKNKMAKQSRKANRKKRK